MNNVTGGFRKKPAPGLSPMTASPDREVASPTAHGSALARLRRSLALDAVENAAYSLVAFGIPCLDTALGSGIDLTATRRLSLAAGRGRALALLLRSTPAEDASAAATRFLVGAAPPGPAGPPGACAASQKMAFGPGPPRFSVRLLRNRR